MITRRARKREGVALKSLVSAVLFIATILLALLLSGDEAAFGFGMIGLVVGCPFIIAICAIVTYCCNRERGDQLLARPPWQPTMVLGGLALLIPHDAQSTWWNLTLGVGLGAICGSVNWFWPFNKETTHA